MRVSQHKWWRATLLVAAWLASISVTRCSSDPEPTPSDSSVRDIVADHTESDESATEGLDEMAADPLDDGFAEPTEEATLDPTDETDGVGPACESWTSDLPEAVETAQAGDVVCVASGRYDVSISIPAGVAVVGQSPESPELVFSGSGAVVTVITADGLETQLAEVNVESNAGIGILVTGDGVARIETTQIRATSGIGIAAEGPTHLDLDNIALTGVIDDIWELQYPIDPTAYPVVGLALSEIPEVSLNSVTISGFAGFGAFFSGVSGVWDIGEVSDNLGIGFLQAGGELTLLDVSVNGTTNCPHYSCAINNQVMAAVAMSGAMLETDGLSLEGNDGIGLFQYQSRGNHSDLTVSDSGEVGVWLQEVISDDGPSFVLSGEQSVLEGTHGAAVLVRRSGDVEISDVSVTGTRETPLVVDETSTVEMADGFQVSELSGTLQLSDVTIEVADVSLNPRVGFVLEATADTGSNIQLSGVDIRGTSGLGLILQGGIEAQPAWTVTVNPTLAEHDAAFEGTLDLAADQSEGPSVAWVEENGLVGPNSLIGDDGSLNDNARVLEDGVLSPTEP